MVKTKENLSGMVYGNLTVLHQVEDYVSPKGRHRSKWACKCSCGNVVDVCGSKLKSGHTKSCKRCNSYIDFGKYVKLIVKSGTEYLIDSDDVEKVKKSVWYERPDGYAYGKVDGKLTLLHRYVLNAKQGTIVDHISGDIKDNRKINLRFCTNSQNAINSARRRDNISGKTGVSYSKKDKKWIAQLCLNKKRVVRKCFERKEDAVIERIRAENEYFGEYRRDGA